ncbi:MAG TPA: diaminopimelate decarboxylase [Clostridiales bacterium UBA8960]|nr:diaminopimelate decarboxylase [Clostridiales bacterium UBA8960]
MFNIDRHILTIEGVSAVELANVYGTPLYVYSESKILEQLDVIRKSFLEKYDNTHAAFACKAFCTKYMCRLLENEGFWLDVVSGGELYTALEAGFPAERIEFNGNNKSDEELIMALRAGIGRIVVDNTDELYHLEKLCEIERCVVKILFRVTPEVSAKTHDYISTGKKDSKFGIPLDEAIIFPAIEYAIQSKVYDFLGFHFHVGSQLMEAETHISALDVVLKLILETKKRFDFSVKDFNLGGGFGIKYTADDTPLKISDFIDPLMERLESFCATHGLVRPHVSMEPGRYIVGEAGIQLYQVGNIKDIPGVKCYVSVDGGMTDNMRPGLYGAKYEAIIANKADLPKTAVVDISGKCCESTDILIKDLRLTKPERGDLLAVFSTGAYGYTMSNNYNKLTIPAVVVVKDSNHRLIVRRQSYAEMVEREI